MRQPLRVMPALREDATALTGVVCSSWRRDSPHRYCLLFMEMRQPLRVMSALHGDATALAGYVHPLNDLISVVALEWLLRGMARTFFHFYAA